jgi:hypothetical protein
VVSGPGGVVGVPGREQDIVVSGASSGWCVRSRTLRLAMVGRRPPDTCCVGSPNLALASTTVIG